MCALGPEHPRVLKGFYLQLLYYQSLFSTDLCFSVDEPSLASCSGGLVSAHSLGFVVASLEADVRELLVNGYPVIIKTWRLQDNPRRAHHHRHREDPEKESVQNHCHVLPILFGLKKKLLNLKFTSKLFKQLFAGPSTTFLILEQEFYDLIKARSDLGGVLLGSGVLGDEVDADAAPVHGGATPGVVKGWGLTPRRGP